jgi:hypothetical protein
MLPKKLAAGSRVSKVIVSVCTACGGAMVIAAGSCLIWLERPLPRPLFVREVSRLGLARTTRPAVDSPEPSETRRAERWTLLGRSTTSSLEAHESMLSGTRPIGILGAENAVFFLRFLLRSTCRGERAPRSRCRQARPELLVPIALV